MKIYCVYILAVLLTVKVNAQNNVSQTITGKVYRAGTDSVIASASVYYSGSMAGTITDAKGNFSLATKQQPIPIIVSSIGYVSATVNYKAGQPLIVQLKPKLQDLREVIVRADGMDRREETQLFTNEFLGTSKLARSCTILNIDDINFFFNKKTKTLTANSDRPIIVANKELGYTVNYYLDSFSCKIHGLVSISGNFIFKEDRSAKDQNKIKRNREDAYEGSRLQFIRALWRYNVAKAGFHFFINDYPSVTEHQIVAHDSLQQEYLHLPVYMQIAYKSNTEDISYLTPKTDFVFIDKNGYCGPGVVWDGAMGSQRIGDLLPFKYQSDKEPKDTEEKTLTNLAVVSNKTLSESVTATIPALIPEKSETARPNQLIFEKAFLHTDRDIYAPGDTLWFKAYLVNAQDKRVVNSSNNLYVDLISPDAKVLRSIMIRLDNGTGNADIYLPDSLRAGAYLIRAYTNWMRNFGDNLIYEKTIDVLGDKVAAVPAIAGNRTGNKASFTANSAVPPITTASAIATFSKATVNFYPEGGSLITGINSIVGVKAEDGSAATGAVISSAGDTIARFRCDSLGMGIFNLIPVKGLIYRAVVKGISYPLPDALSSGLSLQVRHADTLIRIVVSRSDAASSKANFKVKHAGKTIISRGLDLTSLK